MKNDIFDAILKTIKDIDVKEAQRNFKEFFDSIQQVPFPDDDIANKFYNPEKTCEPRTSIEPTRILVDEISLNETVYTVDVFGFKKDELSVRTENDYLVVTGLKKNKIGLYPEGFSVKVSMANSKINGKITYHKHVLVIPTVKITPTSSEDLEIH